MMKKVLIADDHELFLKGIEFILNEMDEKPEIVSATSYAELFEKIETDKGFELILTDLAMPGAPWLDAILKIHETLPDTPIIILSAVFDKEIVQKTIDIGVSGYIPKTATNSVIMSAINLVLSGGVYIPPELLDNKLKKEIEPVVRGEGALTPRQVDVINLISKGMSNKQIAYELGLTEGTVKLHVTAILKILKTYNRTGAVMEATRLGLVKKNG